MWSTLRPGKSPLSALAEAFGVTPDNAGPAAIDTWLEGEAAAYRAGDADKLARIVDRRLDAAPEKPDRLLIYVDQWEELYAMAPPPEDKERLEQHSADVEKFIALLVAAASGAGSRASVVLTVRADFYNPLIRNPLHRRAAAEATGQHPADEPGRLAARRSRRRPRRRDCRSRRRSSSTAFSTTSDWRKAGCRCSSSR